MTSITLLTLPHHDLPSININYRLNLVVDGSSLESMLNVRISVERILNIRMRLRMESLKTGRNEIIIFELNIIIFRTLMIFYDAKISGEMMKS